MAKEKSLNGKEVKNSGMRSPGLVSEKDFKEKSKDMELTEAQSEAIIFYQNRAREAYEQREQRWEYFDNLTYYEDYLANRQAANTYLRPKLNDDEVRIATGTTEKKIEVIFNELLSLNFKPNCKAFDQDDNLMVELSDTWTDIVIRSNEIEKDEDVYKSYILEILTQRAAFVEDRWEVRHVRDRRDDTVKVAQRAIQTARKHLRSGLEVFLGDIKLPWYKFNEQPFIVLYDKISWKEAETKHRWLDELDENDKPIENPMWKFVGKGDNKFSGLNMYYGYINEGEEVEVLIYRSFPDDEEQVMLNGIPMNEKGSPNAKLPWEYDGYNMRMFGLKVMGLKFSYLKPLTASAKTLQSLDNESIRLIIRKWRQSLEPSMGSKKKIHSKDIWSPSTVVSGIEKDDLFLLNPNNRGVDAGDFNMANFIKSKTEEFIGAGDVQAGLDPGGDQTATQIKAEQRNFIIQLGLAVLACESFWRDMSELRTYTLLENATKAIDKVLNPITDEIEDAYMKFTKLDTDLGGGRFGTKRVSFANRDLTDEELKNVKAEEDRLADLGKATRFFTINVNTLRSMRYQWHWSVTQSFKDSEQLDKVMFNDSTEQAVKISQIAGRPLAGDALIKDYEQVWKKKDYFQKSAPQAIGPDAKLGAESPAEDLTPQRPNKPSLNTLVQ